MHQIVTARAASSMESGPLLFESKGPVQKQHMQVRVQVQGRAKALDQGYRARACAGGYREPGFTDKKRGDATLHHPQHLGLSRQQKTQREGKRQFLVLFKSKIKNRYIVIAIPTPLFDFLIFLLPFGLRIPVIQILHHKVLTVPDQRHVCLAIHLLQHSLFD